MSDPQNALAQTSFQLTPRFSASLSSLNFYFGVDSVLKLVQPSINLLEFRTFCATKLCLFSTRYSQIIPFSSSFFNHVHCPCLLALPCVTHSFRGFFILSLVDNFINSGNIFPHFGRDQLTPFLNLLREHPLIKVLGKYRKTICSQHCRAHGRLRIITSVWKVLFKDLKPHNGGLLYISNSLFS